MHKNDNTIVQINAQHKATRKNNPALVTAQSVFNATARPLIIVQVNQHSATISFGQPVLKVDLPADIFELQPIFEEIFPYWWETSMADKVREVIFGLTKKDHIKGTRVIPTLLTSKRRTSVIRIVRPVNEGGCCDA